MKLFRKQKAKIKSHVQEAVTYFISPVSNYIEGKFRLSLRRKIINRKMSRRPRYYMKRVLALYALIFILTVLTGFYDFRHKEEEYIPEETIAGVDEIFNRYNHIQNINRAEREVKQEIAIHTSNILNEIDSLLQKPNKTKEDSAKIKSGYRQIEVIQRNIK